VKRSWKSIFVLGAALLLVGSVVAVAQAAHRKPVLKQLIHTGVHADLGLVRADASTDAFTIDRGVVTAKSDTSLTLLRRDGQSVAIDLAKDTKVRGTIRVGRSALVFSRSGAAFKVVTGGRVTTMSATTTAQIKKSNVVHVDATIIRADGSTEKVTLDRGEVTALTTTSLTIKRVDGQSLTFPVQVGAKVRGRLILGRQVIVMSSSGMAVSILRAGA
jgi:hypothetical protein